MLPGGVGARTRAGLSLDEFGRRAKVGKGAPVGLEKAQGNPNFATLVRLADTLGISVSALMEGPAEGRVRVVSADAVMPLWAGGEGGEARLMLTTSGPAPVEVWRWKPEPGEEYPSHPHQAGLVEIVSVTAGQMVLVVDGTEHPVAAGQTATFDGDAPRTYRGSGTGTCHLITTVHIPPVLAPRLDRHALRPRGRGRGCGRQWRIRGWRRARSAVRASAVGPVPVPGAVPIRTGRTLPRAPLRWLWRRDCSVGSGEESWESCGWCCARSTDPARRADYCRPRIPSRRKAVRRS